MNLRKISHTRARTTYVRVSRNHRKRARASYAQNSKIEFRLEFRRGSRLALRRSWRASSTRRPRHVVAMTIIIIRDESTYRTYRRPGSNSALIKTTRPSIYVARKLPRSVIRNKSSVKNAAQRVSRFARSRCAGLERRGRSIGRRRVSVGGYN